MTGLIPEEMARVTVPGEVYRTMFEEFLGIGVEPKEFSSLQVSARALVVFLYSIVLVRIGDKRFLSRKSALDAVLGFILASMMARAVNGSGALVPTLAGGAVLVLAHRSLSHLAMRWHWFERLVKGRSDLVIKDGELQESQVRANNFSRADLLEDMRLRGIEDVASVKTGYVERSADLSVVRK